MVYTCSSQISLHLSAQKALFYSILSCLLCYVGVVFYSVLSFAIKEYYQYESINDSEILFFSHHLGNIAIQQSQKFLLLLLLLDWIIVYTC